MISGARSATLASTQSKPILPHFNTLRRGISSATFEWPSFAPRRIVLPTSIFGTSTHNFFNRLWEEGVRYKRGDSSRLADYLYSNAGPYIEMTDTEAHINPKIAEPSMHIVITQPPRVEVPKKLLSKILPLLGAESGSIMIGDFPPAEILATCMVKVNVGEETPAFKRGAITAYGSIQHFSNCPWRPCAIQVLSADDIEAKELEEQLKKLSLLDPKKRFLTLSEANDLANELDSMAPPSSSVCVPPFQVSSVDNDLNTQKSFRKIKDDFEKYLEKVKENEDFLDIRTYQAMESGKHYRQLQWTVGYGNNNTFEDRPVGYKNVPSMRY